MRFTTVAILAVFCLNNFVSGGERKKEIYAHYMGCFPVGTGPTAHHRKEVAAKTRHDSKSYREAMGGRVLNWDLVPPKTRLSAEASAELDIKRAMRGGIDGFAIDAWAGGDGAKRTMDMLIKTAERMKVPFKITICLDPSCLKKDKANPGNKVKPFADAIKYLLRHKNSPNLARRDGKPLIFGYHSRGILRTPEMAKLPEGPKKWDKIAEAFREVEKQVGEPLYFYFGMGAFFHRVPKPHNYVSVAKWAGKKFDAVGSFLDTGFYKQENEMAAAIKAGGAEWGQPLWFQYNNRSGSLHVENGLNILRDRWQKARELDSTLIQFVTWNDYGEDTILAPGYNTGYSVLEINKYYIDWWKQGKPPIVDEDKLFLIFRRYPEGCNTFPFKTRRFVPGVCEIVTILKAPGEVVVPGSKVKYKAPAGIYFKQFLLKVGTVSAAVERNGKPVVAVTAAEVVTTRPFRQDNSMVCASSVYDQYWKQDFPGTKIFRYSENSDADKDGLPDWFEMYWFGKLLEFDTATCAKPGDDPDKDGLTNLQEYLGQSNPLKPEAVYKVGDTWDFATVYNRNSSFNPDIDFNETPVWYYLYKHGDRGKIPRDGKYKMCPYSAPKTPYTGKMAHMSPYRDAKYKYIHGWISRDKAADGHWLLVLRPRVQAALILGWKSPVTGTVSIAGKVMPVKGQDGITLEVAKGTEKLFGKVYDVGKGGDFKIDAVNVKKGDFVYFYSDSMPGFDGSKLVLDYLKIKLIKK